MQVDVDVNRFAWTVTYTFSQWFSESFQVNEMLGESDRVFVPYVEMSSRNDVVDWVL